jgi:tetratricopeptide (TPR) repeat protein
MGYLQKIIFCFCLCLSSCSLLGDDLSKAQKLVNENNFPEAIKILNTYKSHSAKKYNSEVHVDYAISILKNLNYPKSERYLKAKELFEQALSLDSQNPKARTFYVMMVKQINLLQLDRIVPVQPAQNEAKENEDA